MDALFTNTGKPLRLPSSKLYLLQRNHELIVITESYFKSSLQKGLLPYGHPIMFRYRRSISENKPALFRVIAAPDNKVKPNDKAKQMIDVIIKSHKVYLHSAALGLSS